MKRTRVKLERNLAPTAIVNDQLHECPCTKALPQSGIRAWIKQCLRKRDRKDRGQEADGKKGSPTKQNTSEEQKQGLPRHRLRLTKKGEKRWTIPSHRMWPTAPDIYKSKRIFSFAVLVKFSTYISNLSKLIVNYSYLLWIIHILNE